MIIKTIYSKLFTIVLCLGIISSLYSESAVQRHGKLRTEGPYLLNENGRIAQLRGMSFYWSTPGWNGLQFYTKDWVDFLADNWKCTVIRAAYDRDNGNNNGGTEVDRIIQAAIDKGIYVIIDWHSHTAEQQQAAAVAYFTQKAEQYKNTPNVIFEPYNEPKWAGSAVAEDGGTENAKKTWAAIKPYLKAVTKAIRSTGSENLVILGTPYFAQHVGVAASDPVLDDNGQPFKNVAYSFHFYAASHGPNAHYVEPGDAAMEASYLGAGLGKVPVFITEWGTTHSNGGQGDLNYIDGENTKWWFENYVNGEYHLSHCNWSVSGFQTSSAFQGESKTASASGTIAKKWISTPVIDHFPLPQDTGYDGTALDTLIQMPGTHSAAYYNRYYGSGMDTLIVPWGSKRDKEDARETKNTAAEITTLSKTTWSSYEVNSSEETQYLHLRYLAQNGSGDIEIFIDSKKAGQISITKNSTWITTSAEIIVPDGKHTIKFVYNNTKDDGYFVEWFELSKTVPTKSKLQHQKKSDSIKLSKYKNGYTFLLPSIHKFSTYILLTADGRITNSGVINRTTSELSFNNISNGIYFLNIAASDHSNQMIKFVVGN